MIILLWRILAPGVRCVHPKSVLVIMGLVLSAALAHAATLYTFANTGPTPYSFSVLELNPLNTSGAFAIAPFQEDGLTFTQATLTQAGGTDCFQFGTAGATLTATASSCGLDALAPDGGWQSLFFGATGIGTFTAFNAASSGSAPAAPNQLTIQTVSAVQYTFSSDGPTPYSFSFLELTPLNTSGAFAIAPFQEGGLTFTQATLTQAGGTDCFQFGTAGVTLTATASSCGLDAFSPDGGWQSLFLQSAPTGTFAAFNAASDGSAPAAPDQLTIGDLDLPSSDTPEPASLVLLASGLAFLAVLGKGHRAQRAQ